VHGDGEKKAFYGTPKICEYIEADNEFKLIRVNFG